MSISSVKTGAIGDSLLAGNAAFNPASYESIATATPTSGTSVTFSSIPSTYASLQIRANMMFNSNGGIYHIRFNGDTATNYSSHILAGDGASAYAIGRATRTQINLDENGTLGPSYPNVFICDIHDYASTTKYKTVRNFGGCDSNNASAGFMYVDLASGSWQSTSAVTSITLTVGAGPVFATGTTISLYGIKG